jgi:hypothetical protein
MGVYKIGYNQKKWDTQAYASWYKVEEKKGINAKIRLMKLSIETPYHLYINLE